MSIFKIIVFILIGCIVASSSLADIYEWTDENGVKHYSNYAPPAKSRVIMKTKEEPYDEEADRLRMEMERQERLELARLEIIQRETELELREAAAERRVADADRAVEEALREADYFREEARTNNRIIYRGSGFGCLDYRYGCDNSIYNRWYYRKGHRRSYHNKLYYLSPYQRYRYIKKHYGTDKKKSYGHKYRAKTGYHQKRHYSTNKWNSRGPTKYRDYRIGSGSGKFYGRSHISRGRSSFGRRR